MKLILSACLFILSISELYPQNEERLTQIRNLYAEYNSQLKLGPEYIFSTYEEGDEQVVKIRTDFSGRVILKVILAGEAYSWEKELYFKNDTVQFIYAEEIRSNHWGEDSSHCEIVQDRYYFAGSKVFKQLTKQHTGRRSREVRREMKSLPNKEVSFCQDCWGEKLKKYIALYKSLEEAIRLSSDMDLY